VVIVTDTAAEPSPIRRPPVTLATADPNQVLQAFFGIPRDQFRLDLAAMSRATKHWAGLERFGDHARLDAPDPAEVAVALHRRVCRAWSFNIRPFVPRATRVYLAAAAAQSVADFAVEAAQDTPGHRLAELDLQLDATRQREGVSVDEEFGADAPDDDRAAATEADVLRDEEHRSALLRFFRRYQFGATATLLRRDMVRYDSLVERGRRQLFGRAGAV
jgi:hypothetical protein